METEEEMKPPEAPRKLEPGVAPIKPEYLNLNHQKKLLTEYLPAEAVKEIKDAANVAPEAGNDPSDPPPAKKMKIRGRNKHRPREAKPEDKSKLCNNVILGKPCPFGERCRYSHNLEEYMSSKPQDLGDTCYIYRTFGKCHYGAACRFAGDHMTESYENKINEELVSRVSVTDSTRNNLDKGLQITLRKRQYNFDRSNAHYTKIQKEVKDRVKKEQELSKKSSTDTSKVKESSESKMNISEDCAQNSGKVECLYQVSDVTAQGSSTEKTSLNSQSEPASETASSSVGQLVENIQEPESVMAAGNTVSEAGNSSIDSPEADKTKTEAGDTVYSSADITDKQTDVKAGPDQPVDANGQAPVKTCGALTDEGEIKLRPSEKKKVDFSNKSYLAPLTTVGNLPFRRVCKKFGVDITCGEMAVSTNILQGKGSEWALLKRHESEDLFGVQVCGGFPDSMTKCAQLITEKLDVDFIDINCGCPIDLIFKRGEGSALMGRSNRFEQVVRGMEGVMDIPLTVKMRTGIFENHSIAHTLVPKLRDWGVSMVTLHGRSREQRYTKLADWDYINQCAKAANPMPLFGNGDILSFEDYNRHLENTDISGIMMARGALIKPWIFTEIKEQRHWDISASERLDMLRDFTNYGLEHWGSDQQGVQNTRRFLLEWLSFLHRYIPVGVLERVPQHINERPPSYFGRNDMETLLASPNCGDWIKITEMFLGPVPSSFTFLPKHKANSYA